MKSKKPTRNIFKRRKRNKFTQIANRPLQEKGLSLEAIGLLVCVMSLPEDFEFGREWARWRFDIGREKLDRIIKELKEAGYVQFEQERDEHQRLGKSVYLFTDEAGNFSDDDEPLPGKPYYGFSVAGKPGRKAGNGTLYKEDKNKKRGADAPESLSNEAEGRQRPAEPEPLPEGKRREIGAKMRDLVASLNVSHKSPFDQKGGKAHAANQNRSHASGAKYR